MIKMLWMNKNAEGVCRIYDVVMIVKKQLVNEAF